MRDQQQDLRTWMDVAGQTVREIPTADIRDDERLLRARLVMEEAVEFAQAMGFAVEVLHLGDDQHSIEFEDTTGRVDLIEAADALADIEVVTIGSAVTLGIQLEPVYAEAMRANWDKFHWVDDEPQVIRDEGGKVMKPEGWTKPDIAGVLKEQGW